MEETLAGAARHQRQQPGIIGLPHCTRISLWQARKHPARMVANHHRGSLGEFEGAQDIHEVRQVVARLHHRGELPVFIEDGSRKVDHRPSGRAAHDVLASRKRPALQRVLKILPVGHRDTLRQI